MTQLCIGGGSVPNATTDQILAAFGVNGTFPLDDSIYQSIAQDSAPDNFKCTGTCDAHGDIGSYGWFGYAVACIKSRQLLFCTKTPGDIPVAGQLAAAQQAATVNELAGAVNDSANAVGSIGKPITGLVAGAIGQIGSLVASIFAHHAAAVRTQDDALNKLCPAASLAIALIDAAVRTGALPAQQAIYALQSVMGQFNSASAQYTKTCNAFCFYSAIFAAIIEASPNVYASPAFQTTGNPGSVLAVQQPTNQNLPSSSGYGAAPVYGVNPVSTGIIASASVSPTILLFVLGIGLVFVLAVRR